MKFWRNSAQPRNPRDVMLFKAANDPSDEVALSQARIWLETYDFDSVVYKEHRLLAIVYARFRAELADHALALRLRAVERQLWMRSHLRVDRVLPRLLYLNQMHVPWLAAGQFARFMGPDKVSRFFDAVDIVTAEEAFGFTLLHLWDNGWCPPQGTSVMKTPKAPVRLSGPEGDQLFLYSTALLGADFAAFADDLNHVAYKNVSIPLAGRFVDERVSACVKKFNIKPAF